MRPFGMILIALGVLALMIHSVTFFTTEIVSGPLGFFAWDVARPHTIFLNPLAGIAAIVIGVLLTTVPGRQAAA